MIQNELAKARPTNVSNILLVHVAIKSHKHTNSHANYHSPPTYTCTRARDNDRIVEVDGLQRYINKPATQKITHEFG